MVDVLRGDVRRYATVLFADLCDYTALNELVDPEEVSQIMHRVRAAVDPLVRKHGGTVNEWRGDGILCTFGLPRASEDDARHALEAALAVHAAIRGLERELAVPNGFEIRFHSGLDTGLLFARERDGGTSFELVGDAVNTAARLCARAGRDEVWATVTTIQGLDEFFELQPVEALSLKGKREAVPARQVIARSQVPTRFAARQRRGLSPLVGRERGLAFLRDTFASSTTGHGQVISVTGAAGVGKTRLLAEFKRLLPDSAEVLEGRCEDDANVAPLRPFIEALRAVLRVPGTASKIEAVEMLSLAIRRLGAHVAPHEVALVQLLGLESAPNADAAVAPEQALADAVSAVLAAAYAEKHLVLLLDDWQWADDAARLTLGGIIRSLRNSRVTIVVASRDSTDPVLSQHPTLELLPLSYDESSQLIASLLPEAFDLGLWQAIHARAGGNPLFLEELCLALPRRALSGEGDFIAGRVPTTLRGIIQVRVERLPDDPARVLRAAAVIGYEVPRWLLGRVSEVPNLARSLEHLLAEDLLYGGDGDDTLRFKHWITREVVYEAVRLPERRHLHEHAARALRAHAFAAALPEPHEVLAYHYVGAGEDQQAARSAELAGDTAASACLLDRARRQYRIAIEALERLGLQGNTERRWLAVVSKWAEASLWAAEAEHLKLLQAARERALRMGDLQAAGRAEYWLGWFCYALGEQPAAIRHFDDALSTARNGNDQRLFAQITVNLGQSLAAAGEYAEAVTHLDRGLELKRAADRARARSARRPPLGYAYALACKGLLLGDRGEFVEAYRAFEEALDGIKSFAHAVEGSCLGLLGMVQLFQGDWASARETAARARATAERVNGPYVFAMSRTVDGYARWVLERRRGAIDDLLHAVKWMQQRGTNLYISLNYAYLADALESAGDVEGAGEYSRLALERAQNMDRMGETMAHRTLARLAARTGGAERDIAGHLARALKSALGRGSAREIALTELAAAQLSSAQSLGDGPPPTSSTRVRADLGAQFRSMGMHAYEREAEQAGGGGR